MYPEQWSSYTSLGSTSICNFSTLNQSSPLSSSSYSTTSMSSSTSSFSSSCPRCPVCAGRRIGSCHNDICRAINNNNNGPVAECHCPKKKQLQQFQQQFKTVTTSNRRTSSLLGPGVILVPSSLLTIIGFLIFPFLPASNLFFYVGFVIAERILYLPSIGACLAIGAAISTSYNATRRKGFVKLSRLILGLTAILLTSMSARTLVRNVDWYNEENLYRSALRINPPKGIYIYIIYF